MKDTLGIKLLRVVFTIPTLIVILIWGAVEGILSVRDMVTGQK